MAEKNNTTCSICGKGYHLCMSCKDAIQLSPWKIHCCSVDCYKVFQVVRGFSTGVYTKEEFKSKLQNIDLSNLDNYREHIKSLIKDALKEKSVVKAVEETKPVKTAATEIKEESVEKQIVSRKRNCRVEVE